MLGLLVPIATAQFPQTDYHLTRDPAHTVYINSAFAHGHRHGYEEGFHCADQDYQLRHMPRLKLPKSTGYRREFGDKQSFQKGFAQGFKAGYIDSYSGQEFRTGELLAEQGKDLPESQDGGAMETLAKSLFPVARSKTFDSGLADGYLTAYTSNDSVAFGPGLGSHASDVCRQDNPTQPVYCSGYGTGYVMGKADQQSIRSIENNDPSKLARALAVLK